MTRFEWLVEHHPEEFVGKKIEEPIGCPADYKDLPGGQCASESPSCGNHCMWCWNQEIK